MPDLSTEQLEALMERAVEIGAQRVFQRLGLQDDNAARDVAELRSLLDSYRLVRRTMLKTATGWFTTALLTALALCAGFKFWQNGGGQ